MFEDEDYMREAIRVAGEKGTDPALSPRSAALL
jgi:hypothetical protein